MANKQQLQSNTDSPMAKLLASQKSSFKTLQKGILVKGLVTKLTPKEILIDIEAKTEAVVLEKDKKILRNILNTVKIGDEVEVSVLNPESDLGHPVVSLRRFMELRIWNKLSELQKKKQTVQGIVRDVTRGGYLLEITGGVVGFLPNSQIVFSHGNQTSTDADGQKNQEMVGKTLDLYLLELNRLGKKIIFSQKPSVGSEEFEQKVKKIKVGQKTDSIVSNITPFGIFVALPEFENLEGLIHISEISWDKVENIWGLYTPGQHIEVAIIGLDKEAKRIELSIRKLTADPFEDKVNGITTDQKLEGIVSKVLSTGVIIEFTKEQLASIEGFIRKEKIPPTMTYEVGQKVMVTVSDIDKKRHRIMLAPVLKEKPIGYR